MKSNIPIQFRRNRHGQGWCVSDSDHFGFVDSFDTAIILDVKLVHNAPPMFCVPGYESTGEAVGVMEISGTQVSMPSEAEISHEIIYDRERRRFHVVGEPNNVVDAADFMVLQTNGTAQVGWKADSKHAPNWLKTAAVA